MEQLLNKLGIPTYVTQISVDLPAAATNSIQLQDSVPESAGWVYGLSVNIGGTHPKDNNKNLISEADTLALWLNLQYGTSVYVANMRLRELTWNFTSAVGGRRQNYTPVSIPADTAWKNSELLNPTGIVSKTVLINVYFIDKGSYEHLVNTGVFWKNGKKTNPA